VQNVLHYLLVSPLCGSKKTILLSEIEQSHQANKRTADCRHCWGELTNQKVPHQQLNMEIHHLWKKMVWKQKNVLLMFFFQTFTRVQKRFYRPSHLSAITSLSSPTIGISPTISPTPLPPPLPQSLPPPLPPPLHLSFSPLHHLKRKKGEKRESERFIF